MTKALPPSDEDRRIEALRECRILDTASEEEFDDLTRLASRICEAPIALMSLVDENRQWFKSRMGLEARETARDIAFCAHAILQEGLMVVPDALADERFRDNPLVTSEPRIRFYAGSPLVLRDGFPVGTLCVLDRVPRALTADQEDALKILSRQVGARLDLRRAQAEIERSRSLVLAANTALQTALAGKQARFGALLEGANDAIWFVSREGKILEVNSAAEEMYGRSRESFVGRDVSSLRSEAARASAPAQLGESLSRGRLRFETEHLRSDGTVFPVEVSTRLLSEGGEPVLLSVVRDISERRKAEARVRQLNRLLRTISEINQLIVRTDDRGALLSDACRILVEHGGFRMAWIGFADRERGLVVPAARAGEGAEYIDGDPVRFDDTPAGSGPTGTAIRTGRHVVVADLASEPAVLPWRTRQLAHGFRCSGALPIGARGAVTGALTVYAAEPSAIGDEETALLGELAADIGHALDALESREARRRAEEKYRSIFENAVEGIVQTTPDGHFASVNPSFVRMLGYDSAEELVSAIHDTGSQVWLHPEGRAAFRRLLEAQGVVKGLETDLRRKDGTTLWVSINACAVRDSTGVVTFYEGTVEDVTERRQAEEERARLVAEQSKTKEQLAAILESVSDAFVALDRDWHYTYVNERAAALFGRTPEDLIGRHIWTEFPDGIDQPFARAYRRALAEQIPLLLEDYYAPWDRWFENRIYPSAEGLSIFFHEITDRKRAEQKVVESEERLRLAVAAANIGLWTWDLRTNAVYFSPEWKRHLGYADGEIPNRFEEWESRLHPEDHDDALARVRAFLEKPEGDFESEFRLRHKDGSDRWIFTHARVLRDEEGRPLRMLGSHIDITQRKRAEEELREKQYLLSESQRIAHVGGWSFDPSTESTYWSDETYRIYGVTPDTFAPDPETFFALVHAEDRARMKEFFRACLSGEHPGEVEFRAVLPDGSVRTLVAQGDYQHGPDHTAFRIVGTVQDITERKRTEVQLHALAARLQSIREEEGTRIAREIHDEPGQNLTALKMDLAWLRRELAGGAVTPDPAALVRHVDEMTALVGQTVETIQRISEELRPAALDKLGLAEAAGAKVEEFQRRAGIASRLSCRLEGVEIDPDLATAAYRVLQELLTNVARHAEATRVDVVLEESRGELLLEVKDDGRGITEAQGSSTKSLGLAGIRERVSLAGGTFDLEGAAGRGTKATARLPLRFRRPS